MSQSDPVHREHLALSTTVRAFNAGLTAQWTHSVRFEGQGPERQAEDRPPLPPPTSVNRPAASLALPVPPVDSASATRRTPTTATDVRVGDAYLPPAPVGRLGVCFLGFWGFGVRYAWIAFDTGHMLVDLSL